MAKMGKPGSANPQQPRLRLHAKQLIASKRYDLAEKVLREHLAVEPNDATAHRLLAICLRNLRRKEEALEEARIAVSLAPESDSALNILAINLNECGQQEAALAIYLQALQINAANIGAILGLCALHAYKSQWDEALHMADRGLAIKPSHALMRTRATALAAQGKEDDAIAAMMEFLRLAPDDAASQSAAATILKQLGRPEEALQFAQQALAMKPASPEYHNALAQLKLKTRRFDDAHLHFAEAGEIYHSRRDGQKGSSAIEIQSLLGQAAVNLRKRNYRLAESQYRRILEIKPDHPLALSMLAVPVGEQYRFDEALKLAKEAFAKYPNLLIARIVVSAKLCQMEQLDEAMLHALHAFTLDPNSALVYRLISIIHSQKDDYVTALEWVQKATQLKQDPETSRLLAVIYAGLGRREEAIATVQAAMSEEPDYPGSYESAGRVFYLLGDFEESAMHFRRAMELDKSRVEYSGWLGLAYLGMGNVIEAKPQLEHSIANNPYQRLVREALAKLQANTSPHENF